MSKRVINRGLLFPSHSFLRIFVKGVPNISELEGQLWRKWKNKIISKRFVNKQVVVLTLNSNENVVAMQPNDDENQDWSLI